MKTLPSSVLNTDPNSLAINERIPFTRRVANLPDKQRMRDAKIVAQLIKAGDEEEDYAKVIDIFKRKYKLLSNPCYWETLRTVWVLCGSTETSDMFRPFFRLKRPCRSWFMTPEDAAELEAMAFPLTVWRAYDPSYNPDPGLSWTINREWCEGYANKKGRLIKSRQVSREEIFAYISRRGESEIIIL